MWKGSLVFFFYCIVFFFVLKKLFDFLESKPAKEKISKTKTKIIDQINVLFCMIGVFFLFYYSKLPKAETYLCFWSYVLILVYHLLLIIPNMKKFFMNWLFFMSLGLSVCSNWAYFHYQV
jgi:hypothetical protein